MTCLGWLSRARSEPETLTTKPVLLTSTQEDDIIHVGRAGGPSEWPPRRALVITNNPPWVSSFLQHGETSLS